MLDPSSVTLGQVSSFVRDFSIVGVLITVVWKSRGFYEGVSKFFERLTKHMDAMEEGMKTLLTNHLAHIEADLRTMAYRQVRATEADQMEYALVEDAPREEVHASSK